MHHGAKQFKQLDLEHTVYHKNVVNFTAGNRDPLKPAKDNGKLHSTSVVRGPFKGYAMYSLTLEERATCSPDCGQLKVCYGNNMPFAKRYNVTDELLAAIDAQLAKLTRKGQKILLRLHILGDFYSVAYVNFWRNMLEKYPTVAAFGYTHWPLITAQGSAVADLCADFPTRFCIKWSLDRIEQIPLLATTPIGGTIVVKDWSDTPKGWIKCPAQMAMDRGRSDVGCAECGIKCALGVNVAFVEH
jgi:hypothetical protein